MYNADAIRQKINIVHLLGYVFTNAYGIRKHNCTILYSMVDNSCEWL